MEEVFASSNETETKENEETSTELTASKEEQEKTELPEENDAAAESEVSKETPELQESEKTKKESETVPDGIILDMPDSYEISGKGSTEDKDDIKSRVQGLIDYAMEFVYNFDYDEALKTLKEANKEVEKISGAAERTTLENEVISHIARIKWITGKWDKALKYCDSIIELKEISSNQTPAIHAFLIKGEILGNRGHYRKAVEICRDALSLADKIGDKKEIADCCYSLGTFYSRIGEAVTGQKLLERAHKIAKDNIDVQGMKTILAKLNNQLGLVHFRKRQLEESQKLFQQTIEMLEDKPYAPERAEALRYMGVTESIQKENKSALSYHSKALWIHKQSGNKFGQAKAYNSIGQTCADIGKLDNAIHFMQKAERICRELGADAEAANIYGKLGNVFTLKEEYDKAVLFFTRDIEMSKKFGNIRALGFANHHIGQCYIYLGRNADAIKHLKHSAELFRKAGDQVNERSTTLNLCAAYINEGNLDEAVSIAEKLGQVISLNERSLENATLMMYQGVIERHMKNWADSSRYLNKAVNILKAQGKTIKLAEAYYEYGLMCLGINDNEGALSKFKEAFKIARDMGLTRQKERYFRMIERIDDLEIVKLMIEELPD